MSEPQLPETHDSSEVLRDIDPGNLTPETLEKLEPVSASSIARLIESWSVEQRRDLLRAVSETRASEILSEMDGSMAAEVFSAMREPRAARLLEDLDPDDAADVFAEMEEEDRERLLESLPADSADTLKQLLAYDPETAGGVMTPEVATVDEAMTVAEAIGHIKRMREEWEDIYYIYVVDDAERLLGVVSMRALILANDNHRLSDIMVSEVRGAVHPEMDRERVAHVMAEHNLLALPVIDSDGVLLGMVTHDDVLDIINQEATEDLQKLVGAGGDEGLSDPIRYSIARRVPWLHVNLLTAFAASGIVALFESQIQQLTLLAVLLPIFASMGGNGGAQTLAIVIRGLALGELDLSQRGKVIRRELILGLANGLLLGITAAVIALVMAKDGERAITAFIVFASMVLTMGVAGLSGAFIPLLLKRMNLDPAQSASIFLTTATDVAGFFIFLSLGSWLLL